MPEISVIIPVYNVETMLPRCLDSVLRQTFSDIEIICVNDGSEDASGKILEKYAQKDKRIKVITKPNGGLSSARNAGMSAAKGCFIAFVDSDDAISPEMLERLFKSATAENTDIAMCAVKLFDYETEKFIEPDKYYTLECFDEGFDNRAFSYLESAKFTTDICITAWNKLYRRSFLEKINAKFKEGLIFEDGAFFFDIYFKTERVSLVRESLYFYTVNRPKSIIEKGGKALADIVPIVNFMCASLKNSDIFEEAKYDFYKKKSEDIIYRFQKSNKAVKRLIVKRLRDNCALFDEKLFDFDEIYKNTPVPYVMLCEMRNGTALLPPFLQKIKRRFAKKVIQVFFEFENAYYFKFWDLKFKIKKCPFVLDIMEGKDGLIFVFFKKIKIAIRADIRFWRRISR